MASHAAVAGSTSTAVWPADELAQSPDAAVPAADAAGAGDGNAAGPGSRWTGTHQCSSRRAAPNNPCSTPSTGSSSSRTWD